MAHCMQVCAVLDIPVDEDALRAAEKAASGGAGDGQQSDSAMEEDASDDVSSRRHLQHALFVRGHACWWPGHRQMSLHTRDCRCQCNVGLSWCSPWHPFHCLTCWRRSATAAAAAAAAHV